MKKGPKPLPEETEIERLTAVISPADMVTLLDQLLEDELTRFEHEDTVGSLLKIRRLRATAEFVKEHSRTK